MPSTSWLLVANEARPTRTRQKAMSQLHRGRSIHADVPSSNYLTLELHATRLVCDTARFANLQRGNAWAND